MNMASSEHGSSVVTAQLLSCGARPACWRPCCNCRGPRRASGRVGTVVKHQTVYIVIPRNPSSPRVSGYVGDVQPYRGT
jgi:hypothetical protein